MNRFGEMCDRVGEMLDRAGAMLEGMVLRPGTARGELLLLTEPLSFWGGIDPATGIIIDERHPQCGVRTAGTILAMPSARGSSSSSSVLAEAIRLGTAPVALILGAPDGIIPLGVIIAEELYGLSCPVVVLDAPAYGCLRDGTAVEITADDDIARIVVMPSGSKSVAANRSIP